MRRPSSKEGEGGSWFSSIQAADFWHSNPWAMRSARLSGRSLQHEPLFSSLVTLCIFYPGLRWVFLAAWAFPPLQRVAPLGGARLLTAAFLLLPALSAGSVLAAQGLVASMARGDLPRPRIESCLLHWRADFHALCHQGSPIWLWSKVLMLAVC